jgi:serine/threonine protein kinase
VGEALPQPIQFGKYTLFERIGRGGMADVFKARVQGPAGFERIFVVKRILPHLSDDPQFTKMFIEEAKMSARLSHPNIVQVFELGSVEEEYFISMEYVSGRDLAETMRAQWTRHGPPKPELVAYVGRELCRALAYAHDLTAEDGSRLGVIHRDVSPSNVMLSQEGGVKILDFGIAKALASGKSDESGTQLGMLKGKFAYMAPEQTQGIPIDHRIDIFAAGAVLHEIITGRRLFKGENDLQTIERVRQCQVAAPSRQNPQCPPLLDSVILKALVRNRDDRFQSCSDMADALDDVVHKARFKPADLAALMRALFPSETAEGKRVLGAYGDERSASGSASLRSTSLRRSPTVPPVLGSASRSQSLLGPPGVPSLLVMPRKPIYRRYLRPALGVAVALFSVAVAGSVALVALSSPQDGKTAPSAALPVPEIKPFTITLRSVPEGADVYLLPSNEHLGRTPVTRTFQWQENSPARVTFRMKDHSVQTHVVSPTWTGVVRLSANAPAEDPSEDSGKTAMTPPVDAAPQGEPDAAPAGRRGRKIKKSGDLVDPF